MPAIRRVLRGAPVFAVAAALFLVTASTSAAALTPTMTSTALPTGFGAITVDATTGRVFVSSPSSNAISVRNADGSAIATISTPGPNSMLSRSGKLYVASATAGRVDVFDTTTLQFVSTLTQGLVSPGPLTWAAGRLWTTSGSCGSWQVHVVSIDPATGATTVYPLMSLSYCPDLVGSDTAAVLVGYERNLSPTTFYRIDVSTGTPTIAASYFSNSSNTKQVRFLPSGDRFVAASGAPYQLVEFRLSDLQPTGVVYPTGAYPNAVAVNAASGRLVGGTFSSYADDVHEFAIGDPTGEWSYDLGSGSNVLYDRGLAWSADGSSVYAVSGDTYGSGSAQLDVFDFPKVATTTTLQASRTDATWGDPVDLTATVAAADGTAVDGTVTFSANGVTVATADLANGAAVALGVTLPAGTDDVVASYDGDLSYARSASAPVAITVHPATTAMSLTGSPLQASGSVRTEYGQPATFDAAITVVETGLPAPSGQVVFRDGDQPLATVDVSGGHATLTEDGLTTGNHTITAEFLGSASASGSSASIRAQILRADSQTDVTASSAKSLPTENVTFTAVVASAIPSAVVPTGTVTFYDGDPLLGSSPLGTVTLTDGRASLTTSFVVPGTHTIYAVYSGSDGYRSSRGSVDHDVSAL